MVLRLVYTFAEGDFEKGMKRMNEPIADASTGAVRDAGNLALSGGRASIAAAGFSTKWTNTFKLRFYPSGASINAAAFLFHKIKYSGVFEEGATIQGKPRLWIPLRNAPKKIGRLRFTPENLRREGVRLFPIRTPSGKSLLAARIRLTNVGQRRVTESISIGTLRRGSGSRGSGGHLVSVPLFVSVAAVHLRRVFRIQEAADAARAALPGLYIKNLKADQ